MLMPPPDTATSKASSFLIILLVFLAGAAAGAAVMSAKVDRDARNHITWNDGGKAMVMDRWKRELNLTDEQVLKIESILDDFSKYYDSTLGEGHERIVQVLTPEQVKKFDRMVKAAKR